MAEEQATMQALSASPSGKRARETETYGDESDLKRATTAAPTRPIVCMLKCLVANMQAGTIIGRGGSVIGQIQKDSGAKVQLSRNGEYFPGTQDRVLMLTADSLNEVLIGFSLVLAKQYESCAKDQGRNVTDDVAAMTVRLVIPNASAGLVIGKGGATIKEIVANSGARVQLTHKEEMMVPDERIVSVTGAMEQQMECTRMILSKMHEDEETASRSQYKNSGVDYQNMMPMPYHNRMGGFRGPPPRQPFPMGGGRMGYSPRSPPTRPGGVMSRQAPGIAGAQSTTTVQVPDAMVGCIIGQAGKTINEIQAFSGARVQISKRGEYFEGTQNRVVTMQGTMEQCQHAQQLIQQTMDSAPAPRQ